MDARTGSPLAWPPSGWQPSGGIHRTIMTVADAHAIVASWSTVDANQIAALKRFVHCHPRIKMRPVGRGRLLVDLSTMENSPSQLEVNILNRLRTQKVCHLSPDDVTMARETPTHPESNATLYKYTTFAATFEVLVHQTGVARLVVELGNM